MFIENMHVYFQDQELGDQIPREILMPSSKASRGGDSLAVTASLGAVQVPVTVGG